MGQCGSSPQLSSPAQSFYDLRELDIDKHDIDFAQFKGQVSGGAPWARPWGRSTGAARSASGDGSAALPLVPWSAVGLGTLHCARPSQPVYS